MGVGLIGGLGWAWNILRFSLSRHYMQPSLAWWWRPCNPQTSPDGSPDCPGPSVLELGSLLSAGCLLALSIPDQESPASSNSPCPTHLRSHSWTQAQGPSAQLSGLALKIPKLSFGCRIYAYPTPLTKMAHPLPWQ